MCNADQLTLLIDFGSHPVSKHYLKAPAEPVPVWPVRLFFCEECGLTQLLESCPPEVLYANYVTLSAWKPQPHAAREIEMLAALPGMTTDARVLEIGCNDGLFMQALIERGFTRVVGIEPAKDAYDSAIQKNLDVVRAFISPELSKAIVETRGPCDLIVSRQSLEHIGDLDSVASSIDILLKPGGYILIEVPNFGCNLQWADYSLWEEHVNQFTFDTLRYFLARLGIATIHEEVILFSGESLVVIGRRSTESAGAFRAYVPALRQQNMEYAAAWPRLRESLQGYLRACRSDGKRVAVYGAGSRGFCLINFTGIAEHIELIVDDQVEKQGYFMPGGRLPIVPSEALIREGIDICLLAVNTENEARAMLRHSEWAAAGGQFWSLFPPSQRLLPAWKNVVTLPAWSWDG